jgi:hypothetical protein
VKNAQGFQVTFYFFSRIQQCIFFHLLIGTDALHFDFLSWVLDSHVNSNGCDVPTALESNSAFFMLNINTSLYAMARVH